MLSKTARIASFMAVISIGAALAGCSGPPSDGAMKSDTMKSDAMAKAPDAMKTDGMKTDTMAAAPDAMKSETMKADPMATAPAKTDTMKSTGN